MKERKDWPQVMIDHILKPEPLDYDEMEWASPLAGMTGFKSLLIFNGSSGVVEVSEQGITAKQRADKVILFPMILNALRLFLKLSFIGRHMLIVRQQGSILKSAVQHSSIGTRQTAL